MSNTRKIGAIILSEVGMFEEAYKIISNVDEEIFINVNSIIKKWAEDNQWHFDDEDCISIWSSEWTNLNDENAPYYARVYLDYDRDEGEDSFWSSLMCGMGKNGAASGFTVYIDQNNYRSKDNKWKSIVGKITPKSRDDIKGLGFQDGLEKGWFFLPIKIDARDLADAYQNEDYDTIFQPYIDGLDKLNKAVPLFTNILKEAENFSVLAT